MSGETPPGFAGEGSVVGFEFFGEGGIVGDTGDDGNVFEVLRSRANHGRTADVDVLYKVTEGYAGLGGCFFEGVEIDHNHIDGLDFVSRDSGFMFGIAADVEQSPMDSGMQRLYAAIEHFREAGEVADVFDGETGFAQRARGTASGDELNTMTGKRFGEIDEPGFVCHAEQRAADWFDACGR